MWIDEMNEKREEGKGGRGEGRARIDLQLDGGLLGEAGC
jgi:hypothetical protein